MELKNYQQDVLKDLAEYIQTWKEQGSLSKAFSSFWKSRGIHPCSQATLPFIHIATR